MNKTELIDKIAEKSGLTKNDARKALEAFIDSTAEALGNSKDGKLALVGFGTFSVSKREAREGKNPRTGEKITIPAKNVVKFKAGNVLENAVE
ncbi:MAG: HU family DNA-binding protein [Bacteroidales bacterium]|nr:HU family DNA-binding protein [Bacteroidales bacterium]